MFPLREHAYVKHFESNLAKKHKMFETHRLHCWVGEKELQWENKTLSKEGLIKQVQFFSKHRAHILQEVEDKILRCSLDVMAMTLDHLHEMLVREPHPLNQTVAEVWCPQAIAHSKVKLSWKERRETFYKMSQGRYYVRIPLVSEIKVCYQLSIGSDRCIDA